MKKIIATLLAMFMLFSVVGATGAEEVTDVIDNIETSEVESLDLPGATVTELDVRAIAEEAKLTYALNFKADHATSEQLEAYGDWYADFVFTINKDVTFNANGEADGYLAGQYDAWSDSWVSVPFEDLAIEANVPLKIMETAAEAMDEAGLKYTYAEVYDVVNDFDCGVYFSEAFIKANADLTTTLELRIYNPENEEESYAISKVYEFKVKAATTEENVVIQGTKVTGNSVEIQDINTESVTPGTTSVKIDTNEFVEENTEESVVDTVKLPVAAVEAVESLGDDATLDITLANGEENDVEISINKEALVAIKEAVNDAGASDVVLKVEVTEDLETEQDNAVSNLENSVVYKVSLETEDGTPVYAPSDAAGDRNIEIKIYYVPVATGDVEVIVKHLKDDGTLEDVNFTYDNNIITMNLAHFSEYVIYEKVAEIPSYSGSSILGGGGGGLAATSITVKFNTNGGSKIANQSLRNNAKVTEPKEPTKEGYTFAGWYTDAELTSKYDFDTKVTKSFTLYAGWVEDLKADEEETELSKTEFKLTIGKTEAVAWGETVENDVAPVITNGRTMLPARFVAENLGAEVLWDAETRKVTIKTDGVEIVIIIDSDVAYVNGEEVKLDSPAFIMNDRTYTPVRFIAENLGAEVTWVEGASEVIITK